MSLIKRSELITYFIRFKNFNLLLTSLSYKKGEALDSSTAFRMKSAGLLSIKEEDEAEEIINNEIKRQVKYFIQDKYYTVRLLLSALAFLLIYFFCSLVLRDPIPMVDELLLGLLGAIVTWLYFDKREGNGAVAHKLTLDLKELYAQKSVELSQAVEQIEAYLYELESDKDPINLSNILAKVDNIELEAIDLKDKDEGEEIKELLYSYLHSNHNLLAIYKKVKNNRSCNKTLAASIYSAHMSGCNVYLLALCLLLLN